MLNLISTERADKLWYDYYKNCPWHDNMACIVFNNAGYDMWCRQKDCPIFHFIQALIYEQEKT